MSDYQFFSVENKDIIENTQITKQENRKPYHEPILQELGDLRALTLGGSAGYGDSGADSGYHRPFGSFADLDNDQYL